MKPYTIFETEIIALTRSSGLSSIAFSFAAALGGFSLKSYFEDSAAWTTIILAGVAALACGAAGLWANNWRNQVVDQIRVESGESRGPPLGWLERARLRPDDGREERAQSVP